MNKQELIKMLNRTMENYTNDDGFGRGVRMGLSMAIFAIKRLYEPEKVAIPRFVADYLDFAKSEVSLMRVLEIANRRDELPKWEKEYDWISANDEKFARAWLDGYEVEKEKLYYVVSPDNLTMLYKDNGVEVKSSHGYLLSQVTQHGFEHKPFYQLTEQEIKDYDERYWPFAVEVRNEYRTVSR